MTDAGLPPDDLPPRELPPKREVAMVLLQSANSLYVHLDPRHVEVLVPTWFKKQPQLVLQVGLNMAVPIVDLDVGEEALSCTLSFNRTPHYCFIPWDAVYALVDPDGRGMVWPDSVPPEVARASGGRDGSRKSAGGEGKAGQGARPRLRLAKDPSEEAPPEIPEEPAAALDPPLAEATRERMTDPAPSEEGHTSAGTVEAEVGSGSTEPPGGAPGNTPGSGEEPDAQEAGRRRPPYLRLVK